MEKIEDREQKFLSKIERKLEVTTEKLQEIRESFSQKLPVSMKRCLIWRRPLTEKISNF